MNDLRLHLIALVCLLAVVLPVISSNTSLAAPESADSTEYDIVIYGGTSAGVATAVQAQRLGLSAVLVSPDRHLGGLTSGGLGWTDSGNKAVIGGLSREFYQRVKKHYDDRQTWAYEAPDDYSRYRPADDAQWTFEPHIAEQVFEEWIAEKNVPVFRDRWLDRKDGVTRKDGRITCIRKLSSKT